MGFSNAEQPARHRAKREELAEARKEIRRRRWFARMRREHPQPDVRAEGDRLRQRES